MHQVSVKFCLPPGGCKWIRTPAIVYSTHVATTLIPILAHILLHQFPVKPHPGPQTTQERWLLVSIYAPYLVVPVLLLLTMLFSSKYNPTSKPGSTSGKAKKKNWFQCKIVIYLIYRRCRPPPVNALLLTQIYVSAYMNHALKYMLRRICLSW